MGVAIVVNGRPLLIYNNANTLSAFSHHLNFIMGSNLSYFNYHLPLYL